MRQNDPQLALNQPQTLQQLAFFNTQLYTSCGWFFGELVFVAAQYNHAQYHLRDTRFTRFSPLANEARVPLWTSRSVVMSPASESRHGGA
jgi:hypothetical protein